MNKLHDALVIIEHLGWKKVIGKEAQDAFDFLYEESLKITDAELTEEHLAVIRHIDALLEDKMFKAKTLSNKPSN